MDPLSHSLPFQLKKRLAGAGLSEDYPNGLKTTDNITIDDLGRVTHAELNYPLAQGLTRPDGGNMELAGRLHYAGSSLQT